LKNNEEEPTNTGDIAFKKIINNENLICVKSRVSKNLLKLNFFYQKWKPSLFIRPLKNSLIF